MWAKVVEIFKSRALIGPTLHLQCPRHPDTLLTVSDPEDFELMAPEGGCGKPCGQQLPCGHSCELLCHSEIRHKAAPCRKLCERGRPDCAHPCPKRCSDPCGPCTIDVENIKLPCGHVLPKLECWKAKDLEKSKPRCETRVTRLLPRCPHEAEMACWQNVETFKCMKICEGAIDCRHKFCSNPCHKCSDLPGDSLLKHAPCQKKCDADFKTCSHRCVR